MTWSDNRPNRDDVMMLTASTFAMRSTCSRAQVGAVIAIDGRVIMTGYNGAPAGMPHCDHTCGCDWGDTTAGTTHRTGCRAYAPCTTAIHAETNAIVYAARHGMGVDMASLFVTLAPCMSCAQLIVAAGITEVWYQQPYRDMSGVEFLAAAGVRVELWPKTA